MNTIEKLGDEETFRQIIERSITSFIDDELMEIAHYSFENCTKLQEVSLPLVPELRDNIFSGCSNLTTFDFSNLKKIGVRSFRSCGFTEVNGPLVTYIHGNAFDSCSSLVKVTFPKVTYIGTYAFDYCPKLSSLIVGTELDDETAICTLGGTTSFPSSISAIYVPYNLKEQYKKATNWSSFADKIQAYDVPVSCQSLTITAEDVPWYKTSVKVHYEAVCTYSIQGMMQTETKVFKGDVVSDTFSINPSGESSRQVEVSYTFLGQTATTTITQGKHIGNPVGGKIYYIDSTADGTYLFYDVGGNPMPEVSVGSIPGSYEIVTPGSKDKYYVYYDELYSTLQWGDYNTTGATGTTIGTGKSNTATVLASSGNTFTGSIWGKLKKVRNASLGGCNDWFVPSRDEVEEARKTKLMESWFKTHIWTSSEVSYSDARNWEQRWDTENKYYSTSSVFFVRAF